MVTPTLYAGRTKDGRKVELWTPDPAQVHLPFSIVSDPEIMKDFMLGREPYRREEMEDYRELMLKVIEDPNRFAWWIAVDSEFAGLVATFAWRENPDLPSPKNRSCMIYYVVKHEFQRIGVASAAVEEAIQYLLHVENLDAVEVQILVRNTASLKLAEKLKFQMLKVDSKTHEENGVYTPVWHGYRLA